MPAEPAALLLALVLDVPVALIAAQQLLVPDPWRLGQQLVQWVQSSRRLWPGALDAARAAVAWSCNAVGSWCALCLTGNATSASCEPLGVGTAACTTLA